MANIHADHWKLYNEDKCNGHHTVPAYTLKINCRKWNKKAKHLSFPLRKQSNHFIWNNGIVLMSETVGNCETVSNRNSRMCFLSGDERCLAFLLCCKQWPEAVVHKMCSYWNVYFGHLKHISCFIPLTAPRETIVFTCVLAFCHWVNIKIFLLFDFQQKNFSVYCPGLNKGKVFLQ